MGPLKRMIRYGFDALEDALDAIAGKGCNPLAHLGAIGWFLFWIVTGSGIYLYIFLDTGVVRAYQSIEAITHGQPWLGGVLRSAHRYASDALVIVAATHLLREFSLDRMRGRRWFAWATGLPLVLFLYLCGLTGYWMVWDRLAQYVATTSARWLDALAIFGEQISQNFVSNASVSSRFFTLIVYLHIAAPLIMLLFMWIHIQRHNYARINPPRRVMIAIGVGLMLLAVIRPAVSQAPANLDHLATQVAIDWFYLPLFPLTDRLGAANLWLLLAGSGLLLAMLPWAPPARARAVARVDLGNCNGCARCFVDCPFTAITMRPRTDGGPYAEEASVDANLCVACGVCVGACPTATPFRRASALVPGIELPHFPMARLRERIAAARASCGAPLRAVVFRCEHGAACRGADPTVLVVDVPCLGLVPPPFLDFILHERLAEGVLLAGCRHDDCYERLGIRWTEERLAGQRDPALRARVPRERLGLSYAGKGRDGVLRRGLAGFLAHLESLAARTEAVPNAAQAPWTAASRRLPAPVRWAAQLAALLVAAGAITALAAGPSVRLLAPNEAVITLSLTHAGKRIEDCKMPSAAAQEARQPNMRRAALCPRRRWPVTIDIDVDGRRAWSATAAPAGLWGDGASSVFHQFKLSAGARQVTIRMRDSGRGTGYDYATTRVARLSPGQNLVIGFTDENVFSFD